MKINIRKSPRWREFQGIESSVKMANEGRFSTVKVDVHHLSFLCQYIRDLAQVLESQDYVIDILHQEAAKRK